MNTTPKSRQRGASLFTSLIILVGITLVSLGSLGTSLMELRMANNAEAGSAAFQLAQAGIEATLAKPEEYYIVKGSVGETRCYNLAGCIDTIDSLPEPMATKWNADSHLKVTRVTNETCPPRTRHTATSCAKQKAAGFVAESSFDATFAGQGRAELAQGYIKLFPALDDRDDGSGGGGGQN
jgi:Tfp pilus assembly protein PilV